MQKKWLAFLLVAGSPFWASAQLTSNDVSQIMARAASRATNIVGTSLATNAVVAVVDREGWVLGVWSSNTNLVSTDDLVANAIAKAGTAAYLSSDQHAFSSRTAGFIVQQNFPPGIQNKPPGPLVGVNFSQLTFSDIEKYKAPGTTLTYGSSPGLSITPTALPITGGLAGTPGGVPLYKAGHLVGGVAVTGDGHSATDITPAIIANPDIDEDAALAGQKGFEPDGSIFGSHVFGGGIRFEYIESSTSVGPAVDLTNLSGKIIGSYAIKDSPPPFYTNVANGGGRTFGGMTGQLRQPIIDDPLSVLGTNKITAVDVSNIISAAANRCRITRAGIRLPRGVPAQVFISVVNNPNTPGVAPTVLGSFCTSPDTTRFSWDVSVQKARTCVFFSSSNRAYSARAVGFLAQSMYPPGIANTQPGIFFGLQEKFSIITPTGSITAMNPVNGAVFTTLTAPDPNLPNGITIFPGGFPLYRNGVLVGAIGVSGDGVDQDDIITASGASVLLAPEAIRSDQTQYRGARIPFAKFPRNPSL